MRTAQGASAATRQVLAPSVTIQADAAHRGDPGSLGGLNLRAQAGQVRLQPQHVRVGLGRPAGACQLMVRDDVTRCTDEGLEQPELCRREGQRDVADPRLVTAGLELQRTRLSGPTSHWTLPPDRRGA